MKKRLTYINFRKMFIDSYSEKELIQLFRAVKRMDDESKSWLIAWIEGEGYPDVTAEKVDIRYLVKECKLKPLNAFITLDWLKNQPGYAKYCLERFDMENGIQEYELKKISNGNNTVTTDIFDAENEFIEF